MHRSPPREVERLVGDAGCPPQIASKGSAIAVCSVPADVGARAVLLLGGGRLHPAQPELRDHQEAGVPRPGHSCSLHEEVCQGKRIAFSSSSAPTCTGDVLKYLGGSCLVSVWGLIFLVACCRPPAAALGRGGRVTLSVCVFCLGRRSGRC